MQPPADALPAATTVLLRDGERGLETLLVRRNAALGFAGGMWVFPGGRIDPEDTDPGAPADEEAAARRAAAREAHEEAGLTLDSAELVVLSRWCPPPEAPKRFNTWFFVGRAPAGEIVVDGGEIHDHLWIRPDEAIRRRDEGSLPFIPPTWITLHQLGRYADVAAALRGVAAAEPRVWVTRLVSGPDGVSTVCWDPDPAFELGDLTVVGPRNRLSMLESGWVYEASEPF